MSGAYTLSLWTSKLGRVVRDGGVTARGPGPRVKLAGPWQQDPKQARLIPDDQPWAVAFP